MNPIGRWLMNAAALVVFPACGPKAVRDAPPSPPVSVERREPSSPDAGLPAVPLSGKGVIVPSDVKLEPAPPSATPPATPATNAAIGPTAN
jgi:hypothetical protein